MKPLLRFIKKHKQNKIFLIERNFLIIIDSKNYISLCQHCGRQHSLYIYGTWPHVSASFDGATDLPICAIIPGIAFFIVGVELYSEPSFGQFICWRTLYISPKCAALTYHLMGNIEQTEFKYYQNISVNGKPTVCCEKFDGRYAMINSDGKEILDIETAHSEISDDYTFKVGNGTLKYEPKSKSWRYIANPALKTKPATRE